MRSFEALKIAFLFAALIVLASFWTSRNLPARRFEELAAGAAPPAAEPASATSSRTRRKTPRSDRRRLDATTTLQILPLALIMVMGPQILTAIFLVTSREPVKNSVAMLIGVLAAASLSMLIWFGLYSALGIDPPWLGSERRGHVVAACWRWSAFTRFWAAARRGPEVDGGAPGGRAEARLQPRLPAHPADAHRHRRGDLHRPLAPQRGTWTCCTPGRWWPRCPDGVADRRLLLLGHRARDAMPKIRDWLTTNAWLVNIIVIVYFIFQLVK